MSTQGDHALLRLAADRTDQLDEVRRENAFLRARLAPLVAVHDTLRERLPDLVTDDPETILAAVDALSVLVSTFAPAELLAQVAAELAERKTSNTATPAVMQGPRPIPPNGRGPTSHD